MRLNHKAEPDVASPLLGPLLTMDELERLQLQVLERRDKTRRAATSPDSGTFRSLFRGHGMELHDVRAYHAGDDIRHMDWRATARSGKPTTKVFVEERNRSLFLLIDRRATMRFGTRGEIKAVSAARAAAILAFSALAAGERVAGIVVDTGPTFFPSARTIDGLLPLLQAITAPLAAGPAAGDQISLAECIKQLEYTAGTGTEICILSDLHDLTTHHSALLTQLGERFETRVIRIVDRAEEQLHNSGRIRIRSPLSGNISVINTADKTIRQRYAETMARRKTELQGVLTSAGIAMTTLYNDQDTFTQLAHHE